MNKEMKNKVEVLAASWGERLLSAQMGHYSQTEKFNLRATLLGGSLIVLTVFITAITFYTPTQENKEFLQWVFRLAGILVTILSAIQTFYKPSERAEIHRAQGARYGSLKRKVEFAIACTDSSGQELCSTLDEVIKEWEGIALDSPLTPFSVIKEIEKKKQELMALKRSKL